MKKVTDKEYNSACRKYAAAHSELEKLDAQRKQDILEVEQAYVKAMQKHVDAMGDTKPTIEAYCEQNKAQMFTDAKSVDTGYGVTVGYRTSPPKLIYADNATPEKLLEMLKRKKLSQYITVKESVNAQAIIKADEDKKLNGALSSVAVAVGQEENFFIKPS